MENRKDTGKSTPNDRYDYVEIDPDTNKPMINVLGLGQQLVNFITRQEDLRDKSPEWEALIGTLGGMSTARALGKSEMGGGSSEVRNPINNPNYSWLTIMPNDWDEIVKRFNEASG